MKTEQPNGRWVRFFATVLGRIFYRVKIAGDLPEKGGVLLACNHVSYVDAFIVGVFFRRRVRFLAYDEFFKVPFLGAVLRASGSIPISARHPKEGTVRAIELLRAGEVVCIFPEGELTRTGEVMGFRRGMELIARRAAVPVVPVFLDMFWGSIFSFAGGKYFWKWPDELPRRLGISIGAPMKSDVHAEEVRQAILSLGVETFARRKELTLGLGWTALRRLKRNARRALVVDCMKEPVTLNCRETLVMALTLAARWRRTLHGRRIGIILPPGRAAVIANLAALFAGKTPVNLNPTVALGAAETTLKVADIEEIITSGIARRLLSKYPWPQATRKIEDEIAAISKGQLGFALAAIWTLPWRWLAAVYRVRRKESNEEAVLLFTSGSSGDPKAVVLTHGNILANVTQISLIGLLTPQDRVLGCLPLFHSFGSTFTLWMPLLYNIELVTTPSPLDANKVGAAAEAGKATILVGTPTFLRTFARKVTPEQFRTVKLAVAGAEKLPAELVQTYQEKYGMPVFEGYGLTETSPVLAVNLPNPAPGDGAPTEQLASRPGSVGRLLPGLAYQLTDPETGAVVEPEKIGVLQVRGASVFTGYLKDHLRTAEVLHDEWFMTGDLARVDADGFLFIEGRLSRFAKIGGEMVPLVKIEECIAKEFQIDGAAGQSIALVSTPHPTKGEELVLITVQPMEREALRKKLTEAGLPNLWIPRAVCSVAEIPMLATGKTDWQTCKRVAAEFVAKDPQGELPV